MFVQPTPDQVFCARPDDIYAELSNPSAAQLQNVRLLAAAGTRSPRRHFQASDGTWEEADGKMNSICFGNPLSGEMR